MNEEETYMGEWPVKPYYKRDLAMGYAPDITPVAALNRLSAWIHHHKPLYQALLDSGYADRQRIFNSVQVGLIYKPQNKMFHFCKTFCSKITLVNTIQNVI